MLKHFQIDQTMKMRRTWIAKQTICKDDKQTKDEAMQVKPKLIFGCDHLHRGCQCIFTMSFSFILIRIDKFNGPISGLNMIDFSTNCKVNASSNVSKVNVSQQNNKNYVNYNKR